MMRFNCKFDAIPLSTCSTTKLTAGVFANLRPNASHYHRGIKSKVVELFEGYRLVPILLPPKQNTTFICLLVSTHFFVSHGKKKDGPEAKELERLKKERLPANY